MISEEQIKNVGKLGKLIFFPTIVIFPKILYGINFSGNVTKDNSHPLINFTLFVLRLKITHY